MWTNEHEFFRSTDATDSPDSPDEENKSVAPAASVPLGERVRPVARPHYDRRRLLHHCIAAIQDRHANPSHPQRFDLLARRQRNPERDLLLDYRRELRRLWMYLDAIAVIRLSRVPPGG